MLCQNCLCYCTVHNSATEHAIMVSQLQFHSAKVEVFSTNNNSNFIFFFVISRVFQNQVTYEVRCSIGANLSEPHIDHDNGPRAWNNGMSVSTCMYHLPHICHTLHGSRDPCTPPHVFWYMEVPTCVIYNNTTWLNSKDNPLPWNLSTKTGRWMCRHMV